MTALVRRATGSVFPDIFEWLDSGWPLGRGPVHIEEFVDDATYVVRAELPGIDIDKDVEVSVANGALTIAAERREDKQEKHRSEFRYGSFARTVTLPRGADTSEITARYAKGVLEIRVPVAEVAEKQRIAVTVEQDS